MDLQQVSFVLDSWVQSQVLLQHCLHVVVHRSRLELGFIDTYARISFHLLHLGSIGVSVSAHETAADTHLEGLEAVIVTWELTLLGTQEPMLLRDGLLGRAVLDLGWAQDTALMEVARKTGSRLNTRGGGGGSRKLSSKLATLPPGRGDAHRNAAIPLLEALPFLVVRENGLSLVVLVRKHDLRIRAVNLLESLIGQLLLDHGSLLGLAMNL